MAAKVKDMLSRASYYHILLNQMLCKPVNLN